MNCWNFENQPEWFEQCCEQEPQRFLPQFQKCPGEGGTSQGVPPQLENFNGAFKENLGNQVQEFLPLFGALALGSAIIVMRR